MVKLLSIGILTHNAGTEFVKTLEAISAQKSEIPVELVVLDTESKDSTVALALEAGARVETISVADFSYGPARDRLFEMCRGELVVTISQDAVPSGSSWLTEISAAIVDGRADVVQGREEAPADGFFWLREHFFYAGTEWWDFVSSHGGVGLSCVGVAVRRSVWKELRFSPIDMCEDKLFQKRAFLAGKTILDAENAVVLHNHDYSIMSLFKRSANEGMGLRKLEWSYPLLTGIKPLLRPYMYKVAFIALCKGKLRTFSEFFFPIIRPMGFLYGYYFRKSYWR